MRKVIYNEKLKRFETITSDLPNLKDWKSSFKKFILDQLKSDSYTEIPYCMFSKGIDGPKIDFYVGAKLQISLLYSLKYQPKRWTSVLTPELGKLIDNIIGSTIDGIKRLKDNPKPKGYERLDKITYKGKPCYSIEGYGSHRIIYYLNLPYQIKVLSVIMHYDDEPRNFLDKCLYEIYNDYGFNKPSDEEIELNMEKFRKIAHKR